MINKEEKKEILRLMELCYNFGQDNIRKGDKVSLCEVFDYFEPRLIKAKKK